MFRVQVVINSTVARSAYFDGSLHDCLSCLPASSSPSRRLSNKQPRTSNPSNLLLVSSIPGKITHDPGFYHIEPRDKLVSNTTIIIIAVTSHKSAYYIITRGITMRRGCVALIVAISVLEENIVLRASGQQSLLLVECDRYWLVGRHASDQRYQRLDTRTGAGGLFQIQYVVRLIIYKLNLSCNSSVLHRTHQIYIHRLRKKDSHQNPCTKHPVSIEQVHRAAAFPYSSSPYDGVDASYSPPSAVNSPSISAPPTQPPLVVSAAFSSTPAWS